MELQLAKESDPVLRQIASDWDFDVDGSPLELVKEMTELMFKQQGIGLAAPQVGVSKRLFIMGNSDKLITCINPVINSGEDPVQDIEGCLSFPKLWLHVKRLDKIKVGYRDIEGNPVEAEFEGLMARVFQHELDHLNGICFDTKVSKLGLKMARERQKKSK